MKLTLGFSPCPNDTFILDALVNKKIDTGGIEFDVMLEDVETLNEWAIGGKLDITKLSFPALFQSIQQYVLLNSGGALGKGVGPLLIAASEKPAEVIDNSSIAIPGTNTTANLLLAFAFPSALNKIPMLFSSIEDAVLQHKTDLGVIIHENRFTYRQKGLHKLADLGAIWEEKMKAPVPLGGIAIKRNIDKFVSKKMDELIRKSLEYAFSNYPVLPGFVKEHAQTMSEDVMKQHIDLYVNDLSLDPGPAGREAILKLFEVFLSVHPGTGIKPDPRFLFL